jgi:hypothetical protein
MTFSWSSDGFRPGDESRPGYSPIVRPVYRDYELRPTVAERESLSCFMDNTWSMFQLEIFGDNRKGLFFLVVSRSVEPRPNAKIASLPRDFSFTSFCFLLPPSPRLSSGIPRAVTLYVLTRMLRRP